MGTVTPVTLAGLGVNGTPKKPDVVVKDGSTVIPASEYDVSYSNNVQIGTNATVTRHIHHPCGGIAGPILTRYLVVYRVSTCVEANYDIYATTTFEIVKAPAKFTKLPTKKEGLTYNGREQELVNAGEAEGGIVFYSLDGVSYLATVPTAVNVGNYTILAKVLGDSKHEDSDPIR